MRSNTALPFFTAFMVSCASVNAPDLSSGARSVVVYEDPATVPPECRALATLTARDGNTDERYGFVYGGSYDRALVRLRNQAAACGGNAVIVLDKYIATLCLDCDVGEEVAIDGQALSCTR